MCVLGGGGGGASFNSSNARDGLIQLLEVNTMPADALAPRVARSSAGMVLAV